MVDASDVSTAALTAGLAAAVLTLVTVTRTWRATPWRRLFGSGVVQVGTLGRRLLPAVCVPQTTLSLILLFFAANLVRSVWQAESINLGWQPAGVVLVQEDFPEHGKAQPAPLVDFVDRTLRGLARDADTQTAALANFLPWEGADVSLVADMDAHGRSSGPRARMSTVTGSYFETLGIPLVGGSGFGIADRARSRRVIVSQSLERRLWGEASVPGRRLAFYDPTSDLPPEWHDVAGVAGDVTSPLTPGGLDLRVYVEPAPDATLPYILIHSRSIAHGSTGTAAVLSAIDPAAHVTRQEAIATTIRDLRFQLRAAAMLVSFVTACSLALTGGGLFAVLSYVATRRSREFGLRLALGARPRQVFLLVRGAGLRIAAIGTILAVPLAYGAIRFVGAWLPASPAMSLAAAATAPLVLGGLVVAAAIPSARRAAAVQPQSLLRET